MVKKQPNKASMPPTYLAFSKTGEVCSVSEPLPAKKEPLELAVATLFKAALAERFGRQLGEIVRGNQWPDFFTTEGSEKVGIEIVEVLNHDHVAKGGYGVPQFVKVDVMHRLLADTVRAKLAKNYEKQTAWKLWLVAYDVTGAVGGDMAIAASVAHAALRNENHPFAEVWLVLPTPFDMPSFLESVWPNTDYTSTGDRER